MAAPYRLKSNDYVELFREKRKFQVRKTKRSNRTTKMSRVSKIR